MKQLYLLLALMATMAFYAQTTTQVASCCAATETTQTETVTEPKGFGRCSGDASCTACKNCSACKHCSKEGGSCGVCATYTAPVKTTPKKAQPAKATTAKQPAKKATAAKPVSTQPATTKAPPVKAAPEPKSPSSYQDREMIEVTSETLNVYYEPGADSNVVIALAKGAMLTFIKYEGEWLYIYYPEKQKNGWVNYKYVK